MLPMETATFLILGAGLIKMSAAISIIFSISKWRRHSNFPYRDQALIAQALFCAMAIHILFRLLCLFWQPTFGFILLVVDVCSTPITVMLALFIKRAVDSADKLP
jgi:hypothetical protein